MPFKKRMPSRDMKKKSLSKTKNGKVFLVGAGPGDPGLITVKGLEILKRADFVLYDHLIPKSLLKRVRRGVPCMDAGKRPGNHALPQDKINEILYQKAAERRTVVRLKGGDPFVFGRGGEEAIFLKERGVEVEVVPGVSSVTALPALCGIPVTHRHLAMTFAIASGHVMIDNDPIPVPDAETLVYVMCVTHLEKTVRELLKRRKAALPCALIENGSTACQRIVTGTLANIVRKARREKLKSPAVFVVGNVVRLREKILPSKKFSPKTAGSCPWR
jgi:uroporphyrinogen III methyltransferase/synthase